MLLRNLQIVSDNSITDILVKGDKIDTVSNYIGNPVEPDVVDFDRAIAFPGLINSHDHLDFNLFPRLGNRLYNNYVEWSTDIHKQNKDVINRVLKVPEHLRVQWGIYKNLLNGVTTVVNHGKKIAADNKLVTVIQNVRSLHSAQLEKYWKLKLNDPLAGTQPFVIHAGEGIDYLSRTEIDNILRWNLFKRDIVAVHGIAMNERQAAGFKGLIWCPDSNYFLIGETAQVKKLAQFTDIVFGTDSTLSAGWNIWDQLRLARSEHVVSDRDLYYMSNTGPADLWQLKGSGKLERSYDADIVIARRKRNADGYDAYYSLNPEDILLVIYKGAIRLFDAELLEQLNYNHNLTGDFSRISVNGCTKFVYGDLPGLAQQIRSYYADAWFPFESIATSNEADAPKYVKHSHR